MARTTPSRGTISPAVGAARIIHANGGCTLAARGRDMCRPRSRGRKGRTTYINAGNRPILHVRAGKDTGCGSPDSLKDFRYTAGSSPCKGCCLLCESRSEVISIRFPRENKYFPASTCFPFSKKIFLTTHGQLMPCERIDYKYSLGEVDEGVFLNVSQIVQQYNAYYKCLEKYCRHCYLYRFCGLCMFHLKN